MIRRRFINPPPGGGDDGNIIHLKKEFAKRLQHLMTEKGWNQSDMARAAAKFMPDKKFNRDNISLYVRGSQLPGPVRLKALCRALGVEQDALMPAGAVATVDENSPPLALRPLGNGNDWLQVNQAVPHDVAMQIMVLLGQVSAASKK
jgi:transcriptional regulator with XRE-family HTH domain